MLLFFFALHTAPSAAPQNFVSSNILKSSFTLSWDKPPLEAQNGLIIGYRINITEKTMFKLYLQMDTENETAVITELEESKAYFASVAAKTQVGVGPYTDSLLITTNSGRLHPVITDNYSNWFTFYMQIQKLLLLPPL